MEFITSALRSDSSMALLYMWMFVMAGSADFVLCHREEHKTLYITSNFLALDSSLIPGSQTFRSQNLVTDYSEIFEMSLEITATGNHCDILFQNFPLMHLTH